MCAEQLEGPCPNVAAIVTDGGYFPAALFVADRLLKYARNFDVVVVTVGFTPQETLVGGKVLKTVRLDLDARMPVVSSRKDRSAATFARLRIDEVLPAHYQRILYLDADVWVGNSNVGALFDLDMQGFPVAAAPDAFEIKRPDSPDWLYYKQRLGHGPAEPYFNAGVMLIDRPRYVAERVGERALEYLVEGKFVGRLDDQSALNAVLRGRWLSLSPVWNWTLNGRPWLIDEYKPAIVHFIGKSKPWRDSKARVPAFVAREMKLYLDTLGLGSFVAPRSLIAGAVTGLRRQVLRLLDLIGLDQSGQRIRNFMNSRIQTHVGQ